MIRGAIRWLLRSRSANEPTHRHKCPQCGVVWEHPDAAAGDTRAHRCPDCGAPSWYLYEGNLPTKYPHPAPTFAGPRDEYDD